MKKTSNPLEVLASCVDFLKLKSADVKKSSLGKFPDKKVLRSDMPRQLAIVAEQAEKLLFLKPGDTLFGLVYHEDDRLALIELFMTDLVQFATLHRIDLGIHVAMWGQTRIAESAFFHLAVSPLLPSTYKTIDQVGGSVFDIYSIPFKLRVALELKLRTITGFEKCEITQNRKFAPIVSNELPFSPLLKGLQSVNCLELPCSLGNIKNIYQWACNFCHTGEKEYVWLSMKALELVSPLFIYQEQKKTEIEIYKIWPMEGMSEKEQCERLLEFKGPVKPLYYFQKGWTVQRLQDALNVEEEKKRGAVVTQGRKKSVTGPIYKYYLSEINLAEISSYYCGRTCQHY
ncbi:hypothetical protein [Serratia sp. DD3]|uniref:hypothetical protein n=1 Tax=Serratia sp. DD3 TaxID=1410619 RepID=UPI0003C4F182|nr:hypothetical protein [Serratia sp. DD3]KEY59672.1 hypothetical protein SRDD_13920 [Serratia sp. DD3]